MPHGMTKMAKKPEDGRAKYKLSSCLHPLAMSPLATAEAMPHEAAITNAPQEAKIEPLALCPDKPGLRILLLSVIRHMGGEPGTGTMPKPELQRVAERLLRAAV